MTTANAPRESQIFVNRHGLARALSISTTMVARLVRQDDFPKPRAIVGAQIGWLLREVIQWSEARPALVVKRKTTGDKS